MDPLLVQIVSQAGGWVVALIVAALTLLPKKGAVENTRIDQLQEDLEATRSEVGKLRDRVDGADRNADVWRRQAQAWNMHYFDIVRGVELGTIPPWPELPKELQ